MAIRFESLAPKRPGKQKPPQKPAKRRPKPSGTITPPKPETAVSEQPRRPKVQITLRIDADVIDHFKTTGDGWQTRINEALRKAMR